jgi:alkane 1-monooxygenase
MDPNTAQLGEGFWGYLIRAWGAGFVAGKRAEDVLRRQSAAKTTPLSHPYVDYVIGSGLALLAAALIAGFSGALALLLVSAYAQVQLYLSDYVQHYGLHRRIEPSGRPEPVGPQHSWNAPHWYSSAMMLNAPRHSDHHVNPARDYPSLRLTPGEMPILPHSLPVMAVIALVPPLWRRLMDKRARRWRDAAHEPVETDWKYRSIHATLVA